MYKDKQAFIPTHARMNSSDLWLKHNLLDLNALIFKWVAGSLFALLAYVGLPVCGNYWSSSMEFCLSSLLSIYDFMIRFRSVGHETQTPLVSFNIYYRTIHFKNCHKCWPLIASKMCSFALTKKVIFLPNSFQPLLQK